MLGLAEIKESVFHLLFPHICKGCGSDRINRETQLCIRCLNSLPITNFEIHRDNPVEKIFWGRLPLVNATAQYYFTKQSLMQRLMHEFKYKGDRDLGLLLGRLIGDQINRSTRFRVDALIPLPLFPAKELRRGYNQAAVLCEGMAANLQVPIIRNVIIRPEYSETQTKKGRLERWKNMDGKFVLTDPTILNDRHVLLVDDVVTTGATLEACGLELLKVESLRLSICTLCIALRQ